MPFTHLLTALPVQSVYWANAKKLPAAISWVLHDPKTQKKAEEVPYEYLVVDREMARAAG